MQKLSLVLSYSLNNINNAVAQFWQHASKYRIIAFSGQLGAGKTTFIHALCEYLGVTDVVSSPTFALINEYHFLDSTNRDNTIYHMDWYRLKDANEAIDAGMEDCLNNKDVYCFIEWPEKAAELLPYPHLWINIEPVNETERKIEISLKTM